MRNRILLYFKKPKFKDKWFWGDRYLRKLLHLLLRKKKVGSIEKVFNDLRRGLELIDIPYKINLPFRKIKSNDQIVVLGTDREVLVGYDKPNKIIAGIGLMTHPANWPNLFEQYPIACYLQHSPWTASIYNRYYGAGKCLLWAAGIDTVYWKPVEKPIKKQILVYEKFLWNREQNREEMLQPILQYLSEQGLPYQLMNYGSYTIEEYKKALEKSYAMIFLCEHESQGLAYQEAMAMNVPIFAYDQGFWLDPKQSEWGEQKPVPASSVPYFDFRCGHTFKNLESFFIDFPMFETRAIKGLFNPRQYILENLTLEKSAQSMLEILKTVYP